ncbi:Major sperm protein [Caenorhabditis elegans]|uniref:Major sperm protein n=1 Tax=Caenorhabditis elegans TaxID=6239 RepID=Q20185_CAEEL|nr:Major sperm protein [Caenorhabditis elegans]CAB01177.2 Major sperm protein [Caenorhabditis elegans]|eukprot:NP_502242.2 Major sperm protein [Caenorhabditis elegans]
MADKKSPVAVGMTVTPSNQANFVDAGSTTLMNKPGEPTFKLGINLNKVEFKCTEDRKPISVNLKLHNPMAVTVSYKVRCTSADIFRVQPPLGFVKPNETVSIVIWYQNQDKKDAISKNHYFAFYHTTSDGRTARELWANSKVEGVRRLPASFLSTK